MEVDSNINIEQRQIITKIKYNFIIKFLIVNTKRK